MSNIDKYLQAREECIKQEAEKSRESVLKQATDAFQKFEQMLNERDMGFTRSDKTHDGDLHFLLCFWYRGTNYAEQGCQCMVNTTCYNSKPEAELKLWKMAIQQLNDLKSEHGRTPKGK